VAGFTFVKNGVKYDYPFIESIKSVLPLCDYFVVVVGVGDDNTLELLKEVEGRNVVVLKTYWDEEIRKGGRLLAIEGTKSMMCIPPHYDWLIYIQADEVIHEDDYPVIREAMVKYHKDEGVEALALNIIQFYCSYEWYVVSPSWNFSMVRIFKPVVGVRVAGDGNTLAVFNRKIRAKVISARIFHYGWVKTTEIQREKRKNFERYWHTDDEVDDILKGEVYKPLPLKRYEGTHPSVMKPRIASFVFKGEVPRRELTLTEKIRWKLRRLLGKDIFGYEGFERV